MAHLKTATKILAACIAIVAVVWWVDIDNILSSAADADLGLLFLAFLLTPLNIWLEVLVWRPLIRVIDSTMSLVGLLKAVFVGFAFGIVTPARVGEFYGRSISAPAGQRWAVSASVVVGRVAESIVLAIIGIVALVFVSPLLKSNGAAWPNYLLLAATAWCVILLGLYFVDASTITRLTRGRLGKFIKPFRFLERVSTRARLEVLLYGTLRYCVFAVQFVLAVRAFGVQFALPTVILVVAVVFLVRSLAPPISFLDLGIREGVAAFVFAQAGMSAAAAFDGALAVFAMNVLLPALVGIPVALATRRRVDAGAIEPDTDAD